jgi:hypothetical protein
MLEDRTIPTRDRRLQGDWPVPGFEPADGVQAGARGGRFGLAETARPVSPGNVDRALAAPTDPTR